MRRQGQAIYIFYNKPAAIAVMQKAYSINQTAGIFFCVLQTGQDKLIGDKAQFRVFLFQCPVIFVIQDAARCDLVGNTFGASNECKTREFWIM